MTEGLPPLVELRADQLRIGDYVDLENDKFCDPDEGPYRTVHRTEYGIVTSLRLETPGVLLVGFEGDNIYGMPPSHVLKIDTLSVDESRHEPLPQHSNYPHFPGRLYDCPACESRCFCDTDPGTTECVFEGEHLWAEVRRAGV